MKRYKSIKKIKNISKINETLNFVNSKNKKYFSFTILQEKVIEVDLYVKLVLKILDDFYKEYKGNLFNAEKVVNALNIIFKTYKFIFKYKGFPNKDIEKSGINFMATEVNKKDKFPYIYIYCNSYLGNCIETNLNYKKFRQKFKKLIEHEFIHRSQFLLMADEELRYRVNTEPYENDEEYFSNYREIMTYAKQMIEELRFEGKTNQEILNIVKNNIGKESSILDLYIQLFKNKNDKVLKRLYKYIYEYLIK